MPDREGEAGLLGQMRIGVDADIGDGEPLAGEEAALLQMGLHGRQHAPGRCIARRDRSRLRCARPVKRQSFGVEAVMPQAIG